MKLWAKELSLKTEYTAEYKEVHKQAALAQSERELKALKKAEKAAARAARASLKHSS